MSDFRWSHSCGCLSHMYNDMELFWLFIGHFETHICKVPVQIFHLFLMNLAVIKKKNFIRVFRVFWIWDLFQIYVLLISSPSLLFAFSLTSLMVTFEIQLCLILLKSVLFYFFCYWLVSWEFFVYIKNIIIILLFSCIFI